MKLRLQKNVVGVHLEMFMPSISNELKPKNTSQCYWNVHVRVYVIK